MGAKRNREYWIINVIGSLCLLVGPFCANLMCSFFTGDRQAEATPKDIRRIMLFVSAGGAVWVLALSAAVLGLITAIKFRSRWGTATACIALTLAINLHLYGIPLLRGR